MLVINFNDADVKCEFALCLLLGLKILIIIMNTQEVLYLHAYYFNTPTTQRHIVHLFYVTIPHSV